MNTYEIIVNPETENEIIVHTRFAKNFNLAETIELQFGIRTVNSAVKVQQMNEQAIVISKNLIQQLLIPLNSQYEIKREQGKLIFGPFIGFYLGNTEKRLIKNMKRLAKYAEHYESINGTLIAFSEDRVDQNTKTIKSFIYDPKSRSWVEGETGYPSSIIRDVAMKREFRNHYVRTVGKTIINEYVVNKWTMHQWLMNNRDIREYLPDTTVYTGPKIVLKYLKKYKTVYVKPIGGALGRGIIKITKKNSVYYFKYKKNGKLINKEFSKDAAITFLNNRLNIGKFLVQQGLSIQHKGLIVDFRTMVLKDGNGEWGVFGFVGKSSPEVNITSNYSSGGDLHLGLELLEKIGFSQKEALQIQYEMEQLSLKVGKQLDTKGYQYGNLGIDICLDANGKIWLIEVNHFSPMHSLIKIAGDVQKYKIIVKTKMSYAKYLAGF